MSILLIDVDIMACQQGVKYAFTRDVKSLRKKLADLYSRRDAIESLIRCLEGYAECRARHEGRERRKSA